MKKLTVNRLTATDIPTTVTTRVIIGAFGSHAAAHHLTVMLPGLRFLDRNVEDREYSTLRMRLSASALVTSRGSQTVTLGGYLVQLAKELENNEGPRDAVIYLYQDMLQ